MFEKYVIWVYLIGLVFAWVPGLISFFQNDHKFGPGYKSPFTWFFLGIGVIPILNLFGVIFAIWMGWASIRMAMVEKICHRVEELLYVLHPKTVFIPWGGPGGVTFIRNETYKVNRCLKCYSTDIDLMSGTTSRYHCIGCGQEHEDIDSWNKHNSWHCYVSRLMCRMSMWSAIKGTINKKVDEKAFFDFVTKEKNEHF